MKKNDIFLILVLLGVSLVCALAFFIYQSNTTQNGVAVVTVDGEVFGKYPLDVDTRVKIGDGNDMNVLDISGGYASIIEASCPDKICVNHRAINKNGQTIVCLPNKVVVEVESMEWDDVDGSTN